MNYQYRCAATFSLSQRHSFTKDTQDPHNINATKSWTQNSHNKQTNKCNNYNMSLYVLDELQIHFQVFVSVWVISADCFDQAGWHLKILSTRNLLPLLGYVFFDPALALHPPRLHLVQIWPATANSPFSLQMFAKFAHIISSRWSALKSVFNFPSFLCITAMLCAGTAPGWSFQGSWRENMTSLRWAPDHDRVQRCKGSNREHIFLASNVYFLQFSEIMYFDCRTLTVTRRTISPTSRGQHAAIFDICDTWVILSKKKKVSSQKRTPTCCSICDTCIIWHLWHLQCLWLQYLAFVTFAVFVTLCDTCSVQARFASGQCLKILSCYNWIHLWRIRWCFILHCSVQQVQ